MSTLKVTNINAADGTSGLSIANSSGNVELKTTNANLILPTGGGISFENHSTSTATGASSTASANVLDDYEEGIYAPTFTATSGTITVNSTYAKMAYTKVGRLVTITGQIVVGSVSSPSGDLHMSLPFVSVTGLENRADYNILPITGYFNGSTAAGAGYYSGLIYITNYSTTGSIIITRTSATSDTSIANWCALGTDLFFNFTYTANS